MSKAPLSLTVSEKEFEALLTPQRIRECARAVFDRAQSGHSPHFTLHLGQLKKAVDRTLAVTRRDYPKGEIPFHSRWGHFQVGGVDRLLPLFKNLPDPREAARLQFDLVIPSVLLDAGSGPQWKFQEASTGQTIARSEGLAVASLAAFQAGFFRDARTLTEFTPAKLNQAFQVTAENPLAGLETRVALIQGLGRAVAAKPDFFPGAPRLGSLVDYFFSIAREKNGKPSIHSTDILRTVLIAFSEVWPTRVRVNGVGFGDLWPLPASLALPAAEAKLIPFHKLSQWLSYSLMEPLMDAGLEIENIDGLTGLPEYRNGGLFLDTGVIQWKNSAEAQKPHRPDEESVIEWRALTVHLLDLLATEIRTQLGKTPEELPLVKILQGGTWSAGREIAKELRPPLGGPPFPLESDGTVF